MAQGCDRGMKPQPLNLEEIEKMLDMIAIVGEDFSEEGADEVLHLRKQKFMQELKQRLKSACKFWLKYHNIEGLKELYANRLWLKVSIHLDKKEKEKLKEFYMNLFDFEGDYVKLMMLENKYNDWLFHLVFKSVLEDDKKNG